MRLDAYTRLALLGSGALGAYSLGANNIANVVGVFLPSQPFPAVSWQGFESSPTQLLIGPQSEFSPTPKGPLN